MHAVTCVLGSPYALGSADLRGRVQVFVCVCGRGGMVGGLAKHRWGYAYVQWRASNDRVSVGGRFHLEPLVCYMFALGSWGRRPLGLDQLCFESGPRVGQELKICSTLFH